MESVSFNTLTFDHPAGRRPARLGAQLCLPVAIHVPAPCMIILTSSAGVQRHREHYYAQALNDYDVDFMLVFSLGDVIGLRSGGPGFPNRSEIPATRMSGPPIAGDQCQSRPENVKPIGNSSQPEWSAFDN